MKLVCDCGNEGELIIVTQESDGSNQTYLDDSKFDSFSSENPVVRIIICKDCGKKIYC